MTASIAAVLCCALFVVLNTAFTATMRRLARTFEESVEGLSLNRRLGWRLTLLLLPATVSLALIAPLVVELQRGHESGLVALCERLHSHCDLFLGSQMGLEVVTYGLLALGLTGGAGGIAWRQLGPTLGVLLRARPLPGTEMLAQATLRAATDAGVELDVRALDGVDAAVCTGLSRPTVVFAPRFLATLDADEVHAVLLHEVAHFRAWDGARNAVLGFVGGLSFLPGASRPMLQRYALDRELASDLRAVSYGADPLALASALVKAGRLGCPSRGGAAALPALPGPVRSALTARVEHLLGLAGRPSPSSAPRLSPAEVPLAVTVLGAAAFVAGGLWGEWGFSLHCLVEELVHFIS